MRDLTTGHILTDWKDSDAARFGTHSLHLQHSLHRSELFTDASLARLLENYPRDIYHVKTSDENRKHREGELGKLSGEEILEAVRNGRIWINLQAPGRVNPAFDDMLRDMYAEFETRVPGLATFKQGMTILISSPKIRVGYHADVPGQMLWQVRGRKRVWVYPARPPFLPQAALENLVLKRLHETDMPYDPSFEEHSEVFDLEPGYMLHWQLNRPHRVENYDCLNVSITTEHWTKTLRNAYAVNFANGLLRSAGFNSLQRQQSGPMMAAKLALAGAAKFSGMTRAQQKPYRIDFAVDPQAELGYRDIPAYEMRK